MAKRVLDKKPNVSFRRKPQELQFVLGQLDFFSSTISYGFSDYNWTTAARIYNNLCGHLQRSERDNLAEIWRECFTNKNDMKLMSDIDLLKAKINQIG